MNFKTTYLMFGLLAALLATVALMQWIDKKPVDKSYVMHDMRAAKVKTADIESIEIERTKPKAEKLVFVRDKDNERWKMTEPHDLRVDRFQVEQIISQVMDAKKDEHSEPSPNPSQYDLDPPLAVVTLTKTGGGEQWKLDLGKQSLGPVDKAVVYVNTPNQPKDVYAVKRSTIDTLFKKVNDFRSKDLLTEGVINVPEALRHIKLQGPKGDIILGKNSDNRWRFEKPDYGEADESGERVPGERGEPERQTGVPGLVEAITMLRVETDNDFVADGVKDLAKYGLESKKPATLLIELKHKSGTEKDKKETTETLIIGNKVDKEDYYYARLEGENHVVRLPAKKLDPILKTLADPSSLRNRDLVHLDVPKTDALDIQNAAGLVKLRKAGEPPDWKLVEGGKLTEADAPTVSKLLEAINTRRQVKDFPTGKDEELGFDKPTAVVKIWVDGIKKEEKKEDAKPDEKKDEKDKDKKKDDRKKDDKKEDKKDPNAEPKLKDEKPTVTLTFGKEEKGVVYVKREMGKDVVKMGVPTSLFDQVKRGKLAYLEHKLPDFSRDEVTKIVLNREGKTIELEAAKKDNKTTWKIKQPKDLEGRTADGFKVEEIINDLRLLHPDEFVTEKASDSDLARFGLNAPRVKVTLTLRKDEKKTEDRVYLFGKDTDEKDKAKLWAKLGEKDLIFIVNSRVLSTLNTDLAESRIFSFDASKVKRLKLTGWQKALTFVVTLDLERKAADPKDWDLKEGPKDFKVDNARVESLLLSLSNLSAAKFVSYKTGPKPEYELGDKDRALQIDITVEGEKQPLVLTVGKLDEKEKGYYAQSSTLPGDVFLVPQDQFAKLLEGVKYFSK